MKGKRAMLRLKLAAIIGALVIGLMSAVPTFAAGYTSVTEYRLAPGATYCLPAQYGTISADAQGTANAGGANFAVFNGPTSPTNAVYLAFTSAGFHATFSRSLPQGAVFPGYFKLCATNPSTTTNTRITMSLATN
jgi:hypothetical protein